MKKLLFIILLMSGICLAQYDGSGYYSPSKWKLSGATIEPLSAGYTINYNSNSALESVTLGSELTDNTGWTSTNWTGSYDIGFTHTTGNTSVLSRLLTYTSGQRYAVTFTISGRTTGYVYVTFGGVNSYEPGHHAFPDAVDGAYPTTTYTYAPLTINNSDSLVFHPSSTFNGTISNISVKQITGTYSPIFSITNSSSKAVIEMRSASVAGNLFIGAGSGQNSTLNIINNTGLGHNALYSNTSGGDNTAVGKKSLYYNTTGSSNTAVGYKSLEKNTYGYGNTSIGISALGSNTSGLYNVAGGVEALTANTTGNYNSAFGGYDAMLTNTTGSSNSAFGYNSLKFNLSGNYNSAFGAGALTNNTESGNSAFGYQALLTNVTGISSAFGYNALYANTASYNSGFGFEVLRYNSTGAQNTAFGHQALYSNTTGSNNTAGGYYALYTNTGGNNTAFGRSALGANTTQSNNTAVGAYALNSNTTFENTAIGSLALYYTTTGYENVGIGYKAGYALADGSTGNATSTNSVYIGYFTKSLSAGRTNEIVIGSEATGSGSNTVTLGNASITNTYLKGDVSIASTKYFYLAGDATTDGSWRIGATTSGNCLIEYRTGGSWTAKATYTP